MQPPIPVGGESSEFQAPFYFLFNLAVGGNFTDAANQAQVTAPLPAKMYIDYVRVYQLDGLGEVKLGNQTAKETGTFGVFTDANTTNKQELGGSADLWVWNQASLIPGSTPPYEGANVISWDYKVGQWFGAGIASRQARDMSNFGNGSLKFKIKIPANVGFKIGIADTYTNEKWLNFPANTTTYGLVRNGDWAQATIPISDIRGINALQSMSQMFMIASIDPLPTANFPMALDDIVWDCGSDPVCLSSGGSSSSGSVVSSSASSVAATSSSSSKSSVVASSSSVVASSSSTSSVSSSSSSTAAVSFDWLVQAENFAATSGVAVVDTTDIGGGKNVENVGAGNWMAFTGLNIPTSGVYQIEYRVASPSATMFSSDLNGGTIQLGNVNVPATGGSQAWTTITQTVTLNAGSYSFGIYAQQGGWSLNWFRITKVTGAASSSVASSASSSSVSSSVASSSASSTSSAYGYTVLTSNSVKFYANSAMWVDIHYIINSDGQQNIRTLHNLDNSNTFTLTGIPTGAVVKYFFTIGPLVGGAFDTPWQSFTMNAVPMACDFNGSNTVDVDDIDMILARKNTLVQGSSPYDINKDGVINLLDSRACVIKCTKTACAR